MYNLCTDKIFSCPTILPILMYGVWANPSCVRGNPSQDLGSPPSTSQSTHPVSGVTHPMSGVNPSYVRNLPIPCQGLTHPMSGVNPKNPFKSITSARLNKTNTNIKQQQRGFAPKAVVVFKKTTSKPATTPSRSDTRAGGRGIPPPHGG